MKRIEALALNRELGVLCRVCLYFGPDSPGPHTQGCIVNTKWNRAASQIADAFLAMRQNQRQAKEIA